MNSSTRRYRLLIAAAMAFATALPAHADLLSHATYMLAQGAAREVTHVAERQSNNSGGGRKSNITSGHPVTVPAAGTVEVAFSPNGGITDMMVKFIGEARSWVLVSAYALTSNPIGKALVEAKKRGVDVRVIVDKDYNGRRESSNSVVSFLASNGIPVRINYSVSINHDKITIVDGLSVSNGSFNYSASAETSNAENVTIHRNFPQLADLFAKNWAQKWSQSQEFRGGY